MRATEHIADLRAEVDQWSSTMGQRIDSGVGEDRRSWWVESRIDNWPPPLSHWSLVAGDAIHNLRSVLDVLVWALADTDALTNSERRALQFPIITDPEKWDVEGTRRLRSVPEPYLTRIRDVQPCWMPEEQREFTGYTLIHELDIQDKHRRAVAARPVPSLAEVSHMIVFEENDPKREVPHWTIDDSRAQVGVLRYHGTTSDRIERISGRLNLTLELTLDTPNGPGGLFHLLTSMSGFVHDTLCHISAAPAPFTVPVPLEAVHARWPHRATKSVGAIAPQSPSRRRKPLRARRFRAPRRIAIQRSVTRPGQ